jgi:hypothetical protein
VVRIEETGRIVRSRDIRLATGVIASPLEKESELASNDVVDVVDIGDILQEEEEEPEAPVPAEDAAESPQSPPPPSKDDEPASRPISQQRTARVKPSWTYVPIVDDAPAAPEPTSYVDNQGIRRNPARTSKTNPRKHHDATFLTYTGPNARNTHLAAEMVGYALVTGFDKDEPRNVDDALNGPQRTRWQKAMNDELENLRNRVTWEEVLTPANRKKIGAKWVLKIKRDAEGNIVKYKARLVAKGYSQVPGIDFEETYAPVGRTTSLRILLTIAATLDLEIHQADVEGAYLNGTLDVDIYMNYPEGVKPKRGCDGLKLKKALYGLKQSGRTWWIELGNKLSKLGFNRLESDWGLYVRPKSSNHGMVMLLVYVDDFVIAAETKQEIKELLAKLKSFWKLSEMGKVSTILGMKVTRDRRNCRLWITQPAYIDRILERFPTHTRYRNWAAPITQNAVTNDNEPAELSPYQEIVGCLQWLAGCT